MRVNSAFHFQLNDKVMTVEGLSPTLTLLNYLRKTRHVGTKEGCAEGDCGACTVAVVEHGPDGQPRYAAVNSCLIPLAALAGKEIVTVEGLSSRQNPLHPVQEVMVATGGSQCGYRTPGFIMSLFAAYYQGKLDDHALEGNLCRCTGYLPIRRAAALLGKPKEDDPVLRRLQASSLPSQALAYEADGQKFFQPLSLGQTLELLKTYPEARLIAGGTDLGLDITKRNARFPVLISLERVEALKEIRETQDYYELGAALPLSQLIERFGGRIAILDDMLWQFAARQIRNRATLGGNLVTASPIGDLAPIFLALDAQVRLIGPEGERLVPLSGFFTGYRKTILAQDEVLVSVRFSRSLAPGAARRLSRAYKVCKRRSDDISIVASAFVLDLDNSDQIIRARLAYGGVAAVSARAPAAEAVLAGKRWNHEAVKQAKAALAESFTPITDLRGSAEYRRMLVSNLLEKFLYETMPEVSR